MGTDVACESSRRPWLKTAQPGYVQLEPRPTGRHPAARADARVRTAAARQKRNAGLVERGARLTDASVPWQRADFQHERYTVARAIRRIERASSRRSDAIRRARAGPSTAIGDSASASERCGRHETARAAAGSYRSGDYRSCDSSRSADRQYAERTAEHKSTNGRFPWQLAEPHQGAGCVRADWLGPRRQLVVSVVHERASRKPARGQCAACTYGSAARYRAAGPDALRTAVWSGHARSTE